MPNLFFLTNPPLRCEWLRGHPAYECSDGVLVRASLELLKAGVRASGELPSGSDCLARICGIDEEKLIEHWASLTHGWTLTDDGNLHHDGIAKHCEMLKEKFGDEIEAIHSLMSALEARVLLSENGPGELRGGRRAPAKTHQQKAARPVFGGSRAGGSAAQKAVPGVRGGAL